MLHVINGSNRHLYQNQIEQHYKIRHDIYVKEHGWKALDRPDGREIDQFDTQDAIYLLALTSGEVAGGSRLIPTEHPHLMSDVFPSLAGVKGLQIGPDIIEWTRFFVTPKNRVSGKSCPLGGEIATGVYEFCLSQGYRQITVVLETYWLTRFLEYGWKITPLGLPEVIDGAWTIGISIDVTMDGLASVQRHRDIAGSVLYHSQDQSQILNIDTI